MESSHRWTFVRYFGTQQVPIGMPGRTGDGRRTLKIHKSSQSSGELKISGWPLIKMFNKCMFFLILNHCNFQEFFFYTLFNLGVDNGADKRVTEIDKKIYFSKG